MERTQAAHRRGPGKLDPHLLEALLDSWDRNNTIKLALKVAGHPISNEEAGPLTWDVWRRKKRAV